MTTFPQPSDSFFRQNSQTFEIIFIDGVHTEQQAGRDIENACRSLSPNGVIIIHDCMPPDAWHQRELEDYKEGENWNGTVWKAVLRFFNRTAYQCILLDTDWGCGVIDTAERQTPKNRRLPENLDYVLHYPLLLEYKNSVAEFLRRQVKVFYHLACMGNWKEVFAEQMHHLKQNGFMEISMTILGTAADGLLVNKICCDLNLTTDKLFHAPELNFFEKPTLLAIEQYAKQNEGHVLYLHSKGVSSPGDETKAKWRRLMMKELVENWERNLLQLPYYDVIGVNWRDMPPVSHFCGNFWYASTRYLKTLADFNSYYNHPLYQVWDNVNYMRLGCEFWISSGSRPPRVLSVYCRNVDFCNPYYWKNK